MSRAKKITFGMVAAKMDKTESISVVIDWMDGAVLNVKRTLSPAEAFSMVKEIAESCVNMDTGEFSPEIFDFVVRVNTLVCYAGFDAPSNLNKAYSVVYDTDIYNIVISHVNAVQYGVLIDAAKQKIAFMKKAMIETASNKIHALVDKMNEVISHGAETMDEIQSDGFREIMKSVMAVEAINNSESGAEKIIELANVRKDKENSDG